MLGDNIVMYIIAILLFGICVTIAVVAPHIRRPPKKYIASYRSARTVLEAQSKRQAWNKAEAWKDSLRLFIGRKNGKRNYVIFDNRLRLRRVKK